LTIFDQFLMILDQFWLFFNDFRIIEFLKN